MTQELKKETGDGMDRGPDTGSDWSVPAETCEPASSYMPAVLALGMVCLLWGITTTWIISMVGAGLVVIGLSGWIGELRHEWHEWGDRTGSGDGAGHGEP